MLLLDEPTNYLDILSLRWLKGFLKAFEGEVIIITHDRDFMDAVTTHTMGIIRRGLFFIKGDTHKFYDQLASNEEHHEKQKVAQDKKIKELEDFISRNKARASTAALAQSKVKQLEKMDILEDLGYDNTLSFDFKYKATPAKILLDVKDVSFGYTEDNLLFENISFVLEKGETLGIIGKNGKGKSTLLNVIAGELKPLAGEVEYNSSVTFGHFGQTNISHLNPKSTIIDEIYSVNSKLGEATVRNICGLMMFSGDNAKKKVSLLSGGEKSRVMLGKIIAKEVNLLFLDEPTHHLDIDSIEALTHAIKDFEGSAIIVSHSEELLRATCDRLIVFSSEGANYFNGTYDEFLEKIGWEDEEFDTKPKKQKNNKNDVKRERSEVIAQKSKELTPLKKELDKLESEIERLEGIVQKSKVEVIEASNKNDNSKVVELTKNIVNCQKNIETKFALFEAKQLKYDELSEMFEKKLEALS
jgi:ATP-binding cassette subfamily F protein 3